MDRGRPEAGHAEIERVVVRDDVAASPRRDDRDMEQLGEPGQLGRRPRTQHAGARQDHRTPGGGEQLDDGPDVLGGSPAPAPGEPRQPARVRSPRRGGPPAATAGPDPAVRSGPRGRPGRWPPGRPPPGGARRPTWRARRASRPGRSPGTPRARGSRARPARRGRTSGSSPGERCGCRSPGWRRRPPSSPDRPPVDRSAGRAPRP